MTSDTRAVIERLRAAIAQSGSHERTAALLLPALPALLDVAEAATRFDRGQLRMRVEHLPWCEYVVCSDFGRLCDCHLPELRLALDVLGRLR